MLGYSRYDEPFYEEENEFIHLDDVEEMRTAFIEVIKSLYGKGDIEDLDEQIEHLCELFQMNKPANALNVERKAPLFNTQMQMVNAIERVANA